jgi:hypothetical protein
MKIRSSFEQELSDWLADGPADAPNQLLETVLAAVPSTPQRRNSLHLAGGSSFMNRNARSIAGVAALVAIVFGTLIVVSRLQPATVGGPPAAPSVLASAVPSAGPAAGYAKVTYRLQPVAGRKPDEAALVTTKAVLMARARSVGIVGVTVAIQGLDEVVVSMPLSNLDSSASLLSQTGLLEFIPLPAATYGTASTNPAGPTGVSQGQPLPNDPSLVPLFGGAAVTSATAGIDQNGQPVVNFNLSGDAATKYSTYTTNNIGNFFAIVLDGIVISAPSIQSAIPDGHGVITVGAGANAQAQVDNLVTLLNFGSLPFPLQEIGVQSGGPPGPGSPAPIASAGSSPGPTVSRSASESPLAGSPAPSAVADRPVLPSCGTEDATTPRGPWNDAARECFVAAYLAQRPVEFVSTSLTTEGDPITSIYRVRDGGQVEIFIDSTRDRYAGLGPRWQQFECPTLNIADLTTVSPPPDPAPWFGPDSSCVATALPVP